MLMTGQLKLLQHLMGQLTGQLGTSGEVRPAACTSGTGEENSPSAAGADDVSMLPYGVVQGNTGEKCTVSGWLNIILPM